MDSQLSLEKIDTIACLDRFLAICKIMQNSRIFSFEDIFFRKSRFSIANLIKPENLQENENWRMSPSMMVLPELMDSGHWSEIITDDTVRKEVVKLMIEHEKNSKLKSEQSLRKFCYQRKF